QFHTLLGTIEQCRRADRIPVRGEAIAHVAYVMVDAKYLLDHHDPLGRADRTGCVSRKREAVGGCELDCAAHGSSPDLWGCRGRTRWRYVRARQPRLSDGRTTLRSWKPAAQSR